MPLAKNTKDETRDSTDSLLKRAWAKIFGYKRATTQKDTPLLREKTTQVKSRGFFGFLKDTFSKFFGSQYEPLKEEFYQQETSVEQSSSENAIRSRSNTVFQQKEHTTLEVNNLNIQKEQTALDINDLNIQDEFANAVQMWGDDEEALQIIESCAKKVEQTGKSELVKVLDQNDPVVQKLYKIALKSGNANILKKIIEYCANQERINSNGQPVAEENMSILKLELQSKRPQTIYEVFKQDELIDIMEGIDDTKENTFHLTVYTKNEKGEWQPGSVKFVYPKKVLMDVDSDIRKTIEMQVLSASSSGKGLDGNDIEVQRLYKMALDRGHYMTASGILNTSVDYLKKGSDSDSDVFEENVKALADITNQNGKKLKELSPNFFWGAGITKTQKDLTIEAEENSNDNAIQTEFENALAEKSTEDALFLLELCSKQIQENPKATFPPPPTHILNQNDPGVRKFYQKALEHKNWEVIKMILKCCVDGERLEKGKNVIYQEDIALLNLKNKSGKDIFQLMNENTQIKQQGKTNINLDKFWKDVGIQPRKRDKNPNLPVEQTSATSASSQPEPAKASQKQFQEAVAVESTHTKETTERVRAPSWTNGSGHSQDIGPSTPVNNQTCQIM